MCMYECIETGRGVSLIRFGIHMHTKFTKYTHEIGLINTIIIKYIALPIERMRYDLAGGSK